MHLSTTESLVQYNNQNDASEKVKDHDSVLDGDESLSSDDGLFIIDHKKSVSSNLRVSATQIIIDKLQLKVYLTSEKMVKFPNFFDYEENPPQGLNDEESYLKNQ